MSHPLPLARAILSAAWERGASGSGSSDGALKGAGVPPERRTEGCSRGWWSRALRWAAAERPKEPPRAGGDGETGGWKAVKRRGGPAHLGRNWRWLRSTRASCEPGGAAPLRAPRGGGRGPGRPLTPCSLARSITHTRRPGLRREGTRGEGGINRERAKGQTPHPRPRARTGGNRNVTQGEPGGSKVQGRACSLDAEEAPSPGAAGAAGRPVRQRRPAAPETRWHVPGCPRQGSARQGRLRGAHSAPGSPSPQVLVRTAPPGAQNGFPPGAQAAVSLSGPPPPPPRAAPAHGQRPVWEPRGAAAGGSGAPFCPTPGAPLRRGRGGARGAYLSAAKCPGGFLPV